MYGTVLELGESAYGTAVEQLSSVLVNISSGVSATNSAHSVRFCCGQWRLIMIGLLMVLTGDEWRS